MLPDPALHNPDGIPALFGRRYGVSCLNFYNNRRMAPIKPFSGDYCRPLGHDTTCRIHTRLLWSEAARMNFHYTIKDAQGTVMTKVSTVQLFTDLDGVLQLDHSVFCKHFLAT